jgi:hypothetical protein
MLTMRMHSRYAQGVWACAVVGVRVEFAVVEQGIERTMAPRLMLPFAMR